MMPEVTARWPRGWLEVVTLRAASGHVEVALVSGWSCPVIPRSPWGQLDVIPRLRSGLLGSQLGVYLWVSWSAPRDQSEVSLDVEASLRSRSPGGQLGSSLRSPGGQPAPCHSSVLGPQRWWKGVLRCVALYNKVPVWLVLAPVAFYTS